jgi:hypothetical protein
MHAGSVKQDKSPATQEVSASLLKQTIVKGETSKEQLLAKLGPPNSIEKHRIHVPKINDPRFEKMKVPAVLMAVETWNYWTFDKFSSYGAEHAVLFQIHIDETGKALDYEISEKELKNPGV